jgi:hypothetical protein
MELRNILASRDKLLENEKANYFDWNKILYSALVVLGVLLVFDLFAYKNNLDAIVLFFLIFAVSVTIAILFMYLLFVLRYLGLKKNRYGKVLCDEDGIIDISDKGYICGFTWDQVCLVVKGRFNTVIFSDFSFSLFVNNDISDELIENMKKFKKDLLVIDRSGIEKKKKKK